MKIEHFALEPPSRPVLLIYGDDPALVAVLREHVSMLVAGSLEGFDVHGLDGFEGVDGCSLSFVLGDRDHGLRRAGSSNRFKCVLRPLWWGNVEGLLEPFCSPASARRFQDLDCGWGEHSDVSLKISSHRGW